MMWLGMRSEPSTIGEKVSFGWQLGYVPIIDRKSVV